MDLGEQEDGEDLGSVRGGEILMRICCMKNNLFSIKKNYTSHCYWRAGIF